MTEEGQLEQRLGNVKEEREKWKHFTPEFVGTKAQEVDLEQARRHMEKGEKIYEAGKLSQREAEVKVEGMWPIAIAFLGDLHIGSVFSNIKEIFRKVKKIEDTPGAYTVLMGNLIDNAIPAQFPSNMLNNTIPPDKQVAVARRMVERLDKKGKVLAALEAPCHEGWTAKHTGQDVNALIHGFPDRKYPVLQNGGRLKLKVGKETYEGALYHQTGPFESHFNKTHAAKQVRRLQEDSEVDFVAAAHRHVGDVEMTNEGKGKNRKEVAYIRTGSEKGTGRVDDKFVVDRYGKTGEPSGQVLHLKPDKKRMGVDLNFDQGMETHDAQMLQQAEKNRAGFERRVPGEKRPR
jgi:hypothetical protein